MSETLERWQREIETRLSALESRVLSPDGAPRATKAKSIAELMGQAKPGSDYQAVVVVGYYLERYRGVRDFTLADLRNGFGEAKRPLPRNSRDLVHRALKNGLMAETGEKRNGFRALTLTVTGERLVEELLTGAGSG